MKCQERAPAERPDVCFSLVSLWGGWLFFWSLRPVYGPYEWEFQFQCVCCIYHCLFFSTWASPVLCTEVVWLCLGMLIELIFQDYFRMELQSQRLFFPCIGSSVQLLFSHCIWLFPYSVDVCDFLLSNCWKECGLVPFWRAQSCGPSWSSLRSQWLWC